MKFEVRRACNGAILRVIGDPEKDGREEVVYQETEDDEIEAFADFLRHLVDNYGPATSRYSPKRIHVVVEPGEKTSRPTSRHPTCTSTLESFAVAGHAQRTTRPPCSPVDLVPPAGVTAASPPATLRPWNARATVWSTP